MLVVVSDLHLTDGTSGQTIKQNAFRIFEERIRDMAFDASFRKGNTYRPIERIDILLLGDILDVIRSTAWLRKGSPVRPWSDQSSDAFIQKVNDISSAILEHNKASLTHLRNISQNNRLTLPASYGTGLNGTGQQPTDKEAQIPVDVKIHYMVGNHDWFYHLPDTSYRQLRTNVVQAIGLADHYSAGFPHDAEESDELATVLREHNVCARHGDIYDSFNFAGDRDESSLGDCIVVELVNRFPLVIDDQMSMELPTACRDGMRELDNVRPLTVIPIWIDALLQKTGVGKQQVKKVKGIWDDLVEDFLKLDFVKDRDSYFDPFDSVDKLQIALKFSKGISLGTAGTLASWWNEQTNGRAESYFANAAKERAFRNREARYLVYGHTHGHEIVPLDSSFSGVQRRDQIYFNSGTWRRVHRLAQLHPDEAEFIAYDVMTYLAFFKGDERKGRPFACWSGALGEDRE